MANRAFLYDRLEGSLAAADADGGGPYAILFCDLDGFKPVNDRFGHGVGDELRLADLALYEAKRRGRNRVVNAPALAGLPD